MPERIHLRETYSTNRYALENRASLRMPVCITADYQLRGKGQGNNIWISEPGKNILMSYVFQPLNLEPYRSFYISKTIALSIVDILQNHVKGISVKWPNDILVEDRKIAGVLIENSIKGKRVERSIVGVGININQTKFPSFSDGPQATSIALETKDSIDIPVILDDFLALLQRWIHELDIGNYELIDQHYYNQLYLFGKWSMYKAGKEKFEARITEVEEDGHLVMENRNGSILRFGFREVDFLLEG